MEPSVWAIITICRGRHIPTITAEDSAEVPNIIKAHLTRRNIYESDAKFNACFSIYIFYKKTRKWSKCSSYTEARLLNQLGVWQRLHFPSDSTTVDMIFAALCTAANIKQRHLIRGTGLARQPMAERAEIRQPRPTSSWLQLVMLKLSAGQLPQLNSPQGRKQTNLKENIAFWSIFCISMARIPFLCIHSTRPKMS